MLPEMPPEFARPRRWASRCSPARRKTAGSTRCCATPERAAQAALQPSGRPAGARGRAAADPAAQHVRRTSGSLLEHRSRPRLPLSVLVLHHHQRAGAQEPLPHRPTTSKSIFRENYAQGIKRFFITDDNFARNRNWEALFDRIIKLREERRDGPRLHHPGRHAVPQDPELHREGGARRRAARVHRARKHQPRQSDRRQEAPEQDHRIPRDAAEMARRTAPSPMPATSSASPATPRN